MLWCRIQHVKTREKLLKENLDVIILKKDANEKCKQSQPGRASS